MIKRVPGFLALLYFLLGPLAAIAATTSATPAAPALSDKERVEADISTRHVAVGANYSGSQVVIFGTVENSKQPTAEAGYYDIAVVIEGPGEALGCSEWINGCNFYSIG